MVVYALNVAEELEEIKELKIYVEVMKIKERKFWNDVAKEEMVFFKKNRIWDFVERFKD